MPPECVFDKGDRQPLKLRTHAKCNHAHHLVDEKIGQLIALRRRSGTADALRFLHTDIGTALVNLDVDSAVWRWIMGFHAALYGEPLRFGPTGTMDPPFYRSLVLPFPKASQETRIPEPIRIQHFRFVETIKINRFKGNVDRLTCNNGQVRYECVWTTYDKTQNWFCAFALNVCDWKDLGATTPKNARGCAGHYMTDTKQHPENATVAKRSPIILPNRDPLDPFAS